MKLLLVDQHAEDLSEICTEWMKHGAIKLQLSNFDLDHLTLESAFLLKLYVEHSVESQEDIVETLFPDVPSFRAMLMKYSENPLIYSQLLSLAKHVAKYADKAGKDILFLVLRESLLLCTLDSITIVSHTLALLTDPTDFTR